MLTDIESFYLQFIIFCSNEEDRPYYFRVFYSNGSQSWYLDEECSNHLDLISIKDFNAEMSLNFLLHLWHTTRIHRVYPK
jgi:hypothetical protein